MSAPDEDLAVAEFFENNQAIGLIACMDREKGNITAELLENVDITDDPFRELLEDAIDANLIEEAEMLSVDHPRSNRYQLTRRGRAVQSLLQVMGLDDLQYTYLHCKQELENAIPDVQESIEDEGLHEKRLDKDYWSHPGLDMPDVDIEGLQGEATEVNSDQPTPPERPDEWESSPADIVDTNEEDDHGRTETWGEPEDEDGGEEEQ